MRHLAPWLAVLLLACNQGDFECDHNRACNLRGDGVCTRTLHRCAYGEPACPGGLRYSSFAGEAANQCVPAIPEDLVLAWPAPQELVLDGDPTEFQIGRPLLLDSPFGVWGRVWFAWDPQGLYVAANVHDPNVTGAPDANTRLWDRDGVEILLDVNSDGGNARLPGTDDFKFLVTAFNTTEAWWGGMRPDQAWDAPLRSATQVRGTVNQATDQDEGYGVEFRIPWSDLLPRPTPGEQWGMNIKLNDQVGGNARVVQWRPGAFNFPAHAGRLGFVGPEARSDFRPRTPPLPSAPRFERQDLAAAWLGASARFQPEAPHANLFDGCVGLTAGCAAEVEDADRVTMEFDLGRTLELGYVRLFGDDRHEWVSDTWSMWVAPQRSGPWRELFSKSDALGLRWFTQDIRGAVGRFVRIRVSGRPGMGLELKELELYARVPPPAP